MKTHLPFMVALVTAVLVSGIVDAQPRRGQGPGFGQRRGRGQGTGRGFGRRGQDERHDADHADFQYLLRNHEKISRDVKELPNGVETLTESDDPDVAAKIKEHVQWMQHRIEETKPIRMRDPLFAELFRHTEKITMERVETDNGVRVTETSEDPYVAKLIKAHAKAVSGFVERGFDAAMRNHAVPGREESADTSYTNPAIEKYGKVVRLPDAVQQPRDGTRLVVDVTAGGPPDTLNPAIEKAARFVNIYRGAGTEPADFEIAIVLHGDATLTVLNVDAYAERFSTQGNPNLDCLHELHEAGVEILVCGQSLIGKDARPEDIVVFADVAVSALTSLVNLQADGYAYVPLK